MLSYQGLDGVIRRTHLYCLSPVRNRSRFRTVQFDAYLEPRAQVTLNLTISCEIGSDSNRHPKSYERAWSATKTEASEIRRDTSKIHSSSDEFNRWIERSQVRRGDDDCRQPRIELPYAGCPGSARFLAAMGS